MKDWKSNKKSTFAMVGASNHTNHERAEYDYYATEPKAAEELLNVEYFRGSIWENACGRGHLTKPLLQAGYEVISTDLIDRGYGKGGVDFFKCDKPLADNITTNPPYSKALEWVQHSLDLVDMGKKVALLLPIQFLESESRIELFKNTPPVRIHVAAKRFFVWNEWRFHSERQAG